MVSSTGTYSNVVVGQGAFKSGVTIWSDRVYTWNSAAPIFSAFDWMIKTSVSNAVAGETLTVTPQADSIVIVLGEKNLPPTLEAPWEECLIELSQYGVKPVAAGVFLNFNANTAVYNYDLCKGRRVKAGESFTIPNYGGGKVTIFLGNPDKVKKASQHTVSHEPLVKLAYLRLPGRIYPAPTVPLDARRLPTGHAGASQTQPASGVLPKRERAS